MSGEMNQKERPRSGSYFNASALHGCIANEGLQSSGAGWLHCRYTALRVMTKE